MKPFGKKCLYASLAAAGALGASGAADAVNVNPRGLGQVLLYPYYTIQESPPGSPYASLMSVVNASPSVKAVRVRFLEGRRGQPVLDFNLFLSPRDVWTAAVLPAGTGAGIATADTSCTMPKLSNSAAMPTPFSATAYLGDGLGDGIERTKEGYVEIIEMGVPTDATIVKSIYHVNGVPPCTGLSGLTSSIAMAAPQGQLFGGMTLINVLAGVDYTSEAVALDAFRTTGRYEVPGTIKPDLTDVDPPIASISDGSIYAGGTILAGGWRQPVDAVSALFMHSNIYSEFVLDSGTKSGTDWVLTMPTKRYYYVGDEVQYLFQSNFSSGACDSYTRNEIYDREERDFGPEICFAAGFCNPAAAQSNACGATNVLSFNKTRVLGSNFLRYIVSPHSNGWYDLQFAPIGQTGKVAHVLVSASVMQNGLTGQSTGGIATFIGLPVIGFAIQSFTNGTLTDATGRLVQSTYGGNFVNKAKRTIIFKPTPGAAP